MIILALSTLALWGVGLLAGYGLKSDGSRIARGFHRLSIVLGILGCMCGLVLSSIVLSDKHNRPREGPWDHYAAASQPPDWRAGLTPVISQDTIEKWGWEQAAKFSQLEIMPPKAPPPAKPPVPFGELGLRDYLLGMLWTIMGPPSSEKMVMWLAPQIGFLISWLGVRTLSWIVTGFMSSGATTG
jgi:hypothetical protein